MGVRSLHALRSSIDIMGEEKTMDSITDKLCVKVMEPTVMVLRYSDDLWGDNLGLMYNLLFQLDQIYSSPIDGLPENVRTKVRSTRM